MKMKDREIEKINSSDIRRLEKTLYKIDRHEKELITEFDNNIVNILGDALKPLLEEIKKNKNLIENIDTRIIKNLIIQRNRVEKKTILKKKYHFLKLKVS